MTKAQAKPADDVPDRRELFRAYYMNCTDQDGKYRYRGQVRSLLNGIASYVQPESGQFFLSQKRAALIMGQKHETYARKLFAQLEKDGIIVKLKRGGRQGNGDTRATRFEVVQQGLTVYTYKDRHVEIVQDYGVRTDRTDRTDHDLVRIAGLPKLLGQEIINEEREVRGRTGSVDGLVKALRDLGFRTDTAAGDDD